MKGFRLRFRSALIKSEVVSPVGPAWQKLHRMLDIKIRSSSGRFLYEILCVGQCWPGLGQIFSIGVVSIRSSSKNQADGGWLLD